MGLDPSPAQQTRGVVDIPIPDFSGQRAAAQTVGEVGKAMLEFGNKLQEAETDRKIVTATNATRSELDKAQRAILEDPNVKPEDYETRYKELSDEIIKRNGAPIAGSGSRAQAVWAQHTGDWQLSGTTQMRSATRQRQLENATAETIATVAKTVEGFSDLDQSEEVFTANFTATHEYISGQVKSGLMAPDRGAQALAELEAGFHKAETERTLYSIDGMRQAKNYAGATEALYAAKKENRIDDKTFSTTKAVLLNEQNGFEAQADADKYWEQGKGYQGGLALARKEPDIAKRQEIEKNLATRAQQDKLAKQDEQDSISKQLADHVLKGGTLANAPTSLLSRVTDSGTLSLANSLETAKTREKTMTAEQKAQLELSSNVAKFGFEALSNTSPQAFMQGFNSWPAEYQTAFKAMTGPDQLAVESMRSKMIQTGPTANAIDAVLQDVTKEAQRFAPSLMDIDEKNSQQKQAKFVFQGILYKNAKALSSLQGGKPITPEQSRKIVLQSMGEYDKNKYGAGVNLALGYMQADEARNVDPDLWAKIAEQQTKTLGRAPTQPEILKAYTALSGQ